MKESGKLEPKIGSGALAGQVRALAFSKDKKSLAIDAIVPGVSETVKRFDFESGKEIATFAEQKDEVWTLAFNPDERFLAAGGVDAQAHVWSVADGKEVASLCNNTQSASSKKRALPTSVPHRVRFTI